MNILQGLRSFGQDRAGDRCEHAASVAAWPRHSASAGADIVGVSASLAPGSDVEGAVTGMGRQFTPYQCDFSDRAALKDFIARGWTRTGVKPDILANNAGTILRTPAAEHPDDMWDKVIEVNLNAQFILSREIGRGMIEKGGAARSSSRPRC